MNEKEYREMLRAEARRLYERDLKWAGADYRNALYFAEHATVYPDNFNTGKIEAEIPRSGVRPWHEYRVKPQWVSQ